MGFTLRLPAVQVCDQRIAEIEEVLRDRLVPVEIERPGLEGAQQRGALAGAELDRPRCADGAEGGSDLRVGLDMLESSHQRLARGPADDDRALVERDGDAVEKHRHGGDGSRIGRRRLGRNWARFRRARVDRVRGGGGARLTTSDIRTESLHARERVFHRFLERYRGAGSKVGGCL